MQQKAETVHHFHKTGLEAAFGFGGGGTKRLVSKLNFNSKHTHCISIASLLFSLGAG